MCREVFMTVQERCLACGSGSPKHPGEVLYWEYLEPGGITIDEAAYRVGFTRQTISNVVNRHSRVTVRIAVALSREFGRSPEEWLKLQTTWDLWCFRQGMIGLTDLSQALGTR